MTPTEKWIFCLALVYAVPSFISGVGITLLFVHWQNVRRAVAIMPRFLSPEFTFERRERKAINLAPANEGQDLLPDGLGPR